MSASRSEVAKLPLPVARSVDDCCCRFEEAWCDVDPADAAAPYPAIEDFLGDFDEPARSLLAVELIRIDVHYRRRVGEDPSMGAYRDRFAWLSPDWLADAMPTAVLGDSSEGGPAAPFPLVPGYEILGVLGRGGMGVVYRARQVGLGRAVALKMIHEHLADDEAVSRFRREAAAVARLQRAGVVQVYDVGTLNGRPYFSFELVEGGNLAEWAAGTPQPPEVAAGLIETLARTIHHAHQRGIIHRDLKPANILLAGACSAGVDGRKPTGAELVPKVTDFGLAKWLDVGLGQTHSGNLLGTPSYMSPEQAATRHGDVGPATDVYALGATLYELMTGRPPFQGASLLETVEQVIGQEPVAPRRLQPRLPRDLETICLKCLEKDPARRYTSAELLANDLRRFREGESILARPVAAPERCWRWARRRPGLALMGAALVVAAAAAVVGPSVLALHLSAARRQSDANADAARASAGRAETQRQIADAESRRAQQAEALARRRLNAAQMTLAHQAWEAGDPGRAAHLLEAQRPRFDEEDLRGFEWYYLYGQVHAARRFRAFSERAMSAIDFSPDGTTLAVSEDDVISRIRLLDASTFQQRGVIYLPRRAFSLAFSHDGRRLAAGCTDGRARLWVRAGDGWRLERTLDASGGSRGGDYAWVRGVDFSADDALLVTAYGEIGDEEWDKLAADVRIWHVDTGELHSLIKTHPRGAMSAAFVPGKGMMLATGGGYDACAKLWRYDAGGWHRDAVVKADCWIASMAFSPDGSTLATVADNGFAYMQWNTADGQGLGPRVRRDGDLRLVAYSPNGEFLAVATSDGRVVVRELATGVETTRVLPSEVRAVTFSPDSRTLVAADRHEICAWSCRPAPESTVLPKATYVVFSKDGSVRAELGPGARAVELATGASTELAGEAVAPLAITADGRRLASLAARDNSFQIHIWDRASAAPAQIIPAPDSVALASADWSPDGRLLALAFGPVQRVMVWDVEARRPVVTRQETFPVYSVAFSPDGKILAIATQDGVVRLYETKAWQLQFGMIGPDRIIQALAFSRDGASIAAGSIDGTIAVWDVRSGRVLSSLKGHAAAVRTLAFLPDGLTLVSGSEDRTVKLWDISTGQERITLRGHPAAVRSVALSPDGGSLYTAGVQAGRFPSEANRDGITKRWDAATSAEARAIRTELDERDPDSPGAAIFAGEVLLLAGRPADAEREIRRAMSRLDKLAKAVPREAAYKRSLVRGWIDLGTSYRQQRRAEDSAAAYRSAMATMDELGAVASGDPNWRYWNGAIHARLAIVLAEGGRTNEAKVEALEALRRFEALNAEFPGPKALPDELKSLADALARGGLLAEAERCRQLVRLPSDDRAR